MLQKYCRSPRYFAMHTSNLGLRAHLGKYGVDPAPVAPFVANLSLPVVGLRRFQGCGKGGHARVNVLFVMASARQTLTDETSIP